MDGRRRLLIGVVGVLWSGVVLAADLLENLINSGQAQRAYELAAAQQAERAGDPVFDFTFGLAAIESGHPQDALFAFERVLDAQPLDQRARLELARAHFMLGNYEQARQLFETVQASNPPARVRDNIQHFLDQMKPRISQRDRQEGAGVTFRSGIDSNINSATEVENITLPVGLVLTLDENSRAISSEFYELAVNASHLQLLRKDSGLFTTFSLNDHRNAGYGEFDLRVTGVGFGYLRKWEGQTLRIPVQWQMVEVDRAMFRTSRGLGVEWGFEVAQQQLALFGQWAQQRHNDSESLRDVDLLLSGAAWSHELTEWRLRGSASLYVANERALDSAYDYFGRRYLGGRLALTWQPAPGHELQLGWSQQAIRHAATHPVFGKERADGYRQLELEWNWRFAPHWTLGLGFSNVDNQSNIELYRYGRRQEYFSVGYEF